MKIREYEGKPVNSDIGELVIGQLLELVHPFGKKLEKRAYIVKNELQKYHGLWIIDKIRVVPDSVKEIW